MTSPRAFLVVCFFSLLLIAHAAPLLVLREAALRKLISQAELDAPTTIPVWDEMTSPKPGTDNGDGKGGYPTTGHHKPWDGDGWQLNPISGGVETSLPHPPDEGWRDWPHPAAPGHTELKYFYGDTPVPGPSDSKIGTRGLMLLDRPIIDWQDHDHASAQAAESVVFEPSEISQEAGQVKRTFLEKLKLKFKRGLMLLDRPTIDWQDHDHASAQASQPVKSKRYEVSYEDGNPANPRVVQFRCPNKRSSNKRGWGLCDPPVTDWQNADKPRPQATPFIKPEYAGDATTKEKCDHDIGSPDRAIKCRSVDTGKNQPGYVDWRVKDDDIDYDSHLLPSDEPDDRTATDGSETSESDPKELSEDDKKIDRRGGFRCPGLGCRLGVHNYLKERNAVAAVDTKHSRRWARAEAEAHMLECKSGTFSCSKVEPDKEFDEEGADTSLAKSISKRAIPWNNVEASHVEYHAGGDEDVKEDGSTSSHIDNGSEKSASDHNAETDMSQEDMQRWRKHIFMDPKSMAKADLPFVLSKEEKAEIHALKPKGDDALSKVPADKFTWPVTRDVLEDAKMDDPIGEVEDQGMDIGNKEEDSKQNLDPEALADKEGDTSTERTPKEPDGVSSDKEIKSTTENMDNIESHLNIGNWPWPAWLYQSWLSPFWPSPHNRELPHFPNKRATTGLDKRLFEYDAKHHEGNEKLLKLQLWWELKSACVARESALADHASKKSLHKRMFEPTSRMVLVQKCEKLNTLLSPELAAVVLALPDGTIDESVLGSLNETTTPKHSTKDTTEDDDEADSLSERLIPSASNEPTDKVLLAFLAKRHTVPSPSRDDEDVEDEDEDYPGSLTKRHERTKSEQALVDIWKFIFGHSKTKLPSLCPPFATCLR